MAWVRGPHTSYRQPRLSVGHTISLDMHYIHDNLCLHVPVIHVPE